MDFAELSGATLDGPACPDLPILEAKSSIFEVVWPGVPDQRAAAAMAMQFQFGQTERWPISALQGHQLCQLAALATFSARTVPFYRDRLRRAGLRPDDALTMERWRRIPLLTRRDIQEAGAQLHSGQVPQSHGGVSSHSTSGSTGTPITALKTQLSLYFWQAVALRDLLWHGVDVAGTLAVLRRDHENRAKPPHGRKLPDVLADTAFVAGPAYMLDIRSPTAEQVDWLVRRRPAYLMSMPSNLALVARYCLETGTRLPTLRQVRTFGAVVTDEFRELCHEAWGVPAADAYSAEETGYIALQCPTGTHYHVQSETILVEVLDEAGEPCAPGQVGRVVVTPLHNFAMPLLRYEIGDYAEVGPPCACGRTLPVISRILGRVRNRVALPNGERRYAHIGAKDFAKVAAVIQYQVVQISSALPAGSREKRSVCCATTRIMAARRVGPR